MSPDIVCRVTSPAGGSAAFDALLAFVSHPSVDERTASVSACEQDFIDIFGIEVVRAMLIGKLCEVAPDVDRRHIALVVDVMVYSGEVRPLTPKGASVLHQSPLSRASFAGSLASLAHCAVWGGRDDLTTLSAAIFVGGPAKACGTTAIELRATVPPADVDHAHRAELRGAVVQDIDIERSMVENESTLVTVGSHVVTRAPQSPRSYDAFDIDIDAGP